MSNSQFHGFEAYNNEFIKQQGGLDFFSNFQEIVAPPPDQFENELDFSLAAFDDSELQLLTVDSGRAYSFIRSDTPTCGPYSAITASSESAYDSGDNRSEYYTHSLSEYSSVPSGYSQSHSELVTADAPLFPPELEMTFQRIRVDGGSDYSASVNPAHTNSIPVLKMDPNSFGTLPPSPPRSPPTAAVIPKSSFSDYIPSSRQRTDTSFFNINFSGTGLSLPSNDKALRVHSHSLHGVSTSRSVIDDGRHSGSSDPKKRYKCNLCPRAFARAYNLKTHMGTHDPNRLKPHVCHHAGCGRSFSRKHDLGRHLVSIHKDDSVSCSIPNREFIGVEKGSRSWCDGCGKGFVAGREKACDCQD